MKIYIVVAEFADYDSHSQRNVYATSSLTAAEAYLEQYEKRSKRGFSKLKTISDAVSQYGEALYKELYYPVQKTMYETGKLKNAVWVDKWKTDENLQKLYSTYLAYVKDMNKENMDANNTLRDVEHDIYNKVEEYKKYLYDNADAIECPDFENMNLYVDELEVDMVNDNG